MEREGDGVVDAEAPARLAVNPSSRPPRWQPYPGHHDHDRVCPRCAEPLIHVGSAFAAPKRRDTAAWRTLSVLLHAGVRFHKSCCGGPGYRPRTLSEVRERMAYARATGEPFARALVRRELPWQHV